MTDILDIENPIPAELTAPARLQAFWREHPECKSLYELSLVDGFEAVLEK
jgi:hypothetical protein